ncbi:E3 SUMO-protein ligase RanBP2-like [Danaus plexippus]|uniref:E3 SUMO-protein ligase RanBP2-like n=1 Tax=Danaus plexippus TaxID=13037 RepID=UPI002AB0CC5F|nr:E3 SUMO-protein ligase RanBP2-like [Danaus plexippus]
MYRNKKDVDKHVESLMHKLSSKDFKTRAFSVARLYYDVGDYRSCQKYVEQYLGLKSNNAAAHKLLGQAFYKLGEKMKALEQYTISYDLDPSQTITLLDICELLANEEGIMNLGRAKYWCEKAEAIYPKHPITFRLRERLLSDANSDPEALVKLLKTELDARPKDAVLHGRLLKHYLQSNKITEAFDHSCDIEFEKNFFSDNYAWYECLSEVLKYNNLKQNNWLYQLLLLTVRERLCVLSLTEVPNASGKNLLECSDLLNAYDQALDNVAKSGHAESFGEFHTNILQHHRGQIAFHAATLLLKKAKKNQTNWREVKKFVTPLMLIAWQTVPLDLKVNWLVHAPQKQQNAIKRWYVEGSYRCSQSGHYLLSNIQDKSQIILDQISELCSGTNWKDKLYETLFTTPDQLSKKNTSYLVSKLMTSPALRLPRKLEVQAYDDDAQREYPSSLHHFVWMLLNYKNYADFKCTLFDMLTPNMTSCGPETLNKIDVLAFLYSTTLTTRRHRDHSNNFHSTENVKLLPANITDLLCSLPQIKWWDCAYKLSQNDLGFDHTDIRSTLSRGIEVIRCVDNHGIDPELLCMLGRIFNEIADKSTTVDEKSNYEQRACVYYSSAINLLQKIKGKVTLKLPDKKMFDYPQKEYEPKELNNLLEESKLYVAQYNFKEGEYEKVIGLLSNSKSPEAYYHLSQTYVKIAKEEKNLSKHSESDSKYRSLLEKAKVFAYRALEKVKEQDMYKTNSLYVDIQELIEDLESCLNKCSDLSGTLMNDESSDENISDIVSSRTKSSVYRNISSTPKQMLRHPHNVNATNYRTATDSHILDNTQLDNLVLERIENQIKNLQKRDFNINNFMEQTKDWFDENKKLSNQIMNTIKTNIDNTTEQFKLLKISVDQVKEQIDECRSECKDVVDMKKQIAELKKEVNKLKKSSSEQGIDESDVYNIDDDYRASENTPSFAAQLPFAAPQPFAPPFAQRIAPPFPLTSNPYQFYGQNLYNLYNQYSQIAQSSTVPGGPPLFDPTRAHMNYPGVFPTPDQMYLDVAHLVPPTIPAAVSVPPVHNVPAVTTVVSTSTSQSSAAIPTSKAKHEVKESNKIIPANVVITSSDPLPTTISAPAPVLSVTIPQKHIKGSPHNYQISMPTSNVTKAVPRPVFTFPTTNTSTIAVTPMTTNWNMKSIFKPDNPVTTSTAANSSKDTSTCVVDGIFSQSSPNTSLNKSRTLSEKSNTSVENYDPCPDFKPIIPLPAEVKVTTGEEDESVIFSARAKLFRFVDKQWKERGIGEMKLLKHKVTGKVRVLMRREQVHKICANHIILPEMEIKPMKNETKAYFWVANDFAEETVILEKFCIKFKTPELAKEFYETFEKARKESAIDVVSTEIKTVQPTKSQISSSTVTAGTDGKTVVGGFTFSSKPSFKTVTEDSNTQPKVTEAPTTKVNVFTGVTFKTATSSPFSNLSTTTNLTNTVKTPESTVTSSKLNNSDVVEEFEPTVDFKPVIPLPALVDQKTGEEDEIVLFEYRAKLLRFDASIKEWKERGLGNIKLLCQKENNQKLRLLMRREQIMKVCCNLSVTKEMVFQKMPNMDKAVTFCGKDFSEGELVPETFCLRFKTVQACDDFINAVKTAQSKIGEDTKAVKEEQNAAKQNVQVGFGEKFKPQPGSWECKECLIRNESGKDYCCACNSPKDPTVKKAENKLEPVNTPKFNFGIPSQGAQTAVNTSAATTATGWGDKFKAKEGTWECSQCYVRNKGANERCVACNNPTNPDISTSKPDVKFTFGITPKTNEATGQNTNNIPKFSFGIPQEKTVSFGIPTTKSSNVFKAPEQAKESDGVLDLGIKKQEEQNIILTPTKPALLPTPQTNVTPFGKESGTFEFSFNQKNVTKGKSPVKSPKDKKDHDSDDNEYASEDEGHHIHFSPVIPMPDKIKVVTGEENEIELYGHRAKLFIFSGSEWKERGIGIVKILKHKETGKLRVLMRREQVHKICLNHALNKNITYQPKDEKSWFFFANDFSEGEILLQNFCLRFQNKEVALQFKEAVDNALSGKSETSKVDADNKLNNSEDVVFVNEIQASNEDKQKARDLMLPENFYNYVNKEPCQGCRGCDDSDKIPVSNKVTSKSIKPDPVTTTPLKTSSASNFQSPVNSLYGTPTNLDRTIDTTVFRTPLGAIGSNTTTVFASSANNSVVEQDSPDKENTLTNSSTSENSQTPATIISGSQDSSSSVNPPATKSWILAPPKLSVPNTAKETTDKEESKSLFGSTNKTSMFGDKKSASFENKSIFGSGGVSTNKSIFGFNLQNNKGDTQASESGSIFSSDKPVNLFSSSSSGSIFGPAALKSNQSTPPTGFFSSVGTFTFGSQNKEPIFSAKPADAAASEKNTVSDKDTSPSETHESKKDTLKEEKSVSDNAPVKADNALFSALSSSGPGFDLKKQANFQWEGAGQQLFSSMTKKSGKSGNTNDDSGGGAEDEYDPHYEPIVPLPDKIVVTTGEEDEEKLFGERCKLYRFDEKTREWKERGVGEMKLLYHPEKKSYRLLLRREQVHKAVLNMLLFMDLQLLPTKNSETSWTWAGRNYAESSGEQETLAAKFKNVAISTAFHNKVVECVRKLQAAAAEAIRQEKDKQETETSDGITPLRLPKHLMETSRADSTLFASSSQSSEKEGTRRESSQTDSKQNGQVTSSQDANESLKQVHFEEDQVDYDDCNYDQEDYNEHSGGYYNEDEETAMYFPCKAVVRRGDEITSCEDTHVQVSFDQDVCSPKVMVTDTNTGEILADMLIHADTEFQLTEESCSWTGMDYTSNVSVEKTVTITFADSNLALEFYDLCETSKASTDASTDPES